MLARIFQKKWLSPLVGVFFVAVGLSGTLMLFHVRVSGMRALHEWIGLAFVIVTSVHVLLNWQAVICYCKTRAGLISIVIGILLCALFLLGGSGQGEHHRPSPGASDAH